MVYTNLKITFFLIILVITIYNIVLLCNNTQYSFSYSRHLKHQIKNLADERIISCYNVTNDDELPSAETFVLPTNKSIFFIETTCRGYLTARQACSVESTSRSHNNWTIYVLFLSPVTKESLSILTMKQVSKLHNVKLLRIHLNKFAVGSPLLKHLNNCKWKIIEVSDVGRLLTLYKWGGIYLDLDVVIARPLDTLGQNWIARESGWSLSTGAMSMSTDALGRRVAKDAVMGVHFNVDPNKDQWTHNGPKLLTSVFRRLCRSSSPHLMNAEDCKGFKVYGPEYFYPLHWTQWKEYFKPGGVITNTSYGYHVWNYHSAGYKVHKQSFYAKLANKFCPTVYNMFKDNF